jgi:peroxiredoxin
MILSMKTLFCSLLTFVLAISSFAVEIGKPAPDFTLSSVDGKTVKLSDYKGKIVVLEWFNMGCPFVQKHYKNQDMQNLQKEYTDKGVVWLGINSTNPAHKSKNYLTPKEAAAQVKEFKMNSTAMLQDADGKVGKAYGATSTPHMYVIDASGNLVYRGAIDDQPKASSDPKRAKNYVRAALDEILAGKPVSTAETKQYGCSIKYAE